MKKLVSVVEVEGEGLASLMGEYVVLWTMNYNYSGRLVGVNSADVLLEDAVVVYETGPLKAKSWKDAQELPGPLYVRTAAIECYYKRGW